MGGKFDLGDKLYGIRACGAESVSHKRESLGAG